MRDESSLSIATTIFLSVLIGCANGAETESALLAVRGGDEQRSSPFDNSADRTACAMPSIEAWAGRASRSNNSGHPDDALATVMWRRVATTGCVDTYRPNGTVRADFAVPGALCAQSIQPGSMEIDEGDGVLIVDRSEAPVTYSARGATSWSMTWTCKLANGAVETSSVAGGGTWIDAAGIVEGRAITGELVVEQAGEAICGAGTSSLCIYRWSFDAE